MKKLITHVSDKITRLKLVNELVCIHKNFQSNIILGVHTDNGKEVATSETSVPLKPESIAGFILIHLVDTLHPTLGEGGALAVPWKYILNKSETTYFTFIGSCQ